jgi:formate hydrogenlyase subunit 3/multisubunit Na+/H+ antiporter MnhD subunit
MKQTEPRRMLGYSSIAQMGLVTGAAAWGVQTGNDKVFVFMIILPLLFNHFFAKMALFWVTGLIKKSEISEWGILRDNKVLHLIFVVMVIASDRNASFSGFLGQMESDNGSLGRFEILYCMGNTRRFSV